MLAERWEIAGALRDELVVARSLAFAEIKPRDHTFIWAWEPGRDLEAAILGPITLSALSLLMEKKESLAYEEMRRQRKRLALL